MTYLDLETHNRSQTKDPKAKGKKWVIVGVCNGHAFMSWRGRIFGDKESAVAKAKDIESMHAGTYQAVEIEA